MGLYEKGGEQQMAVDWTWLKSQKRDDLERRM